MQKPNPDWHWPQVFSVAAAVVVVVVVSETSFGSDAAAELLAEANQSIAADNYDEAHELLRQAFVGARSAGNRDLLAEVQETQRRARALERGFNSIEGARERLAQSPADPAANTEVGRFYCFRKRDWDRGLELLAIGELGALRDAAEADRLAPDEVIGQIHAGDSWIQVASDIRDGDAREELHLRARHWYLQALAAADDDSQLELVHRRLDMTDLYPTKIVLYNAHNGPHNDRGTLLCNLVLLSRGETVFHRLPQGLPRDIPVPGGF